MGHGQSGGYVVFDVETPNRRNDRMSSIGMTIIEGGKIVEELHTLIDPEQPFDAFNTKLTGIDASMVSDAPTFSEAWDDIEPIMSHGILVAHNATFDLGVLRKCLQGYGIPWRSEVPYICTVQMGRRILPQVSHKLDVVCERYGIALDHHRADNDSRACAEILLRYVAGGTDVTEHVRTYEIGDTGFGFQRMLF